MKSAKRLMMVTFTLLITASLLFVWWMSYSNFKVNYQDIKQEYYAVVAEQVVSEVETSVKYGKTLDSFYNIDSVFDEIRSELSNQFRVMILNSKNELLYTSFEQDPKRAELLSMVNKPNVVSHFELTDGSKYAAVSEKNYEIMVFPVRDKTGAQIGKFVLLYPDNISGAETDAQRDNSLKVTLIILGVSVLLLVTFLLLFRPKDSGGKDSGTADETHKKSSGKIRAKLPLVIPAVIVLLSIVIQSGFMYFQYQDKYKTTLENGAKGILVYIDNTLKKLHDKGVAYDQMDGIEEYMASKVKETPILWNMRIHSTLYDTGKVLHRDDTLTTSLPLEADQNGGYRNTSLEISISQEYLNKNMTAMLLSFLITILIAGIIIFEFIRLPDMLTSKRNKQQGLSAPDAFAKVPQCLRMSTFMMFLGVYVSFPYSASLIRQWGIGLFGMSVDLTASLPVTAELLSVMVFSIFFSHLIKIKNLRVELILSAFLIIVGNLLSATAPSPLSLILIRMICGAGFAGLKTVLNAVTSSGCADATGRGRNLSEMNAGLLGGITCGGSLGAVVSGSIGVTCVYFFTTLILFIFAVLTFFVMPWLPVQTKINVTQISTEAKKQGGAAAFLTKGSVWRYLLLVTVPLNIGLMFIVSFIPGLISKLGLPSLLTSYGYLFNGMAGIYLGPPLAKAITRKLHKSACIVIMLVMGAASMLLCSVAPGAGSILFATALMGLFDGFGTPITMDYFIEMPQIRGHVDNTGALAVLGVFGSAVQMVSPMLYGAVMAVNTGASVNAIFVVGAAYLIFALLFALTSKSKNVRSRAAEG